MKKTVENYTINEIGFDRSIANAVAAVIRHGATAGRAAGSGERLECVILNAKKEGVELV
ncbi:MAG: hypothetical protein UX75_C0037G0016 [Candidatus Moranbacteria bacterium GW2011_GWE2_47_10]|nr:MAG: hypothetical protein UX75_C0037G0016 [Candidatus Moranbacteria bacterium GW2011_GWE2_47_10]